MIRSINGIIPAHLSPLFRDSVASNTAFKSLLLGISVASVTSQKYGGVKWTNIRWTRGLKLWFLNFKAGSGTRSLSRYYFSLRLVVDGNGKGATETVKFQYEG